MAASSSRASGSPRASSRIFRDFLGVTLALACLCALSFADAFAATPKNFVLNAPEMETDSGEVIVKLGVGVDSIEGLRDMLKDGAIMELSITAKLLRVRGFLPNVTLSEQVFVSPLRHNPLTREFSLAMPGAEQAIVDKNLTRLVAATWQKLQFSLGPASLMTEPDSEYRIVLDFSLRHTEVPPWLAKAFLFWSWDVVEPESLAISFTF